MKRKVIYELPGVCHPVISTIVMISLCATRAENVFQALFIMTEENEIISASTHFGVRKRKSK
jgi:hypothetical protein